MSCFRTTISADADMPVRSFHSRVFASFTFARSIVTGNCTAPGVGTGASPIRATRPRNVSSGQAVAETLTAWPTRTRPMSASAISA